jgi:nicotinamide-nucleotide amidase
VAASAAPTYAAIASRMRPLHEALLRRGLSIASAESCTGGLLATVLTEHPGSSGYYRGGLSVYSDEAKASLAEVTPQLLHAHGAVSPVVAAALARGARQRLSSDIGLGITGIAGPEGATPGKPVGLVYVAIESEPHSTVRTYRFSFDRAGNRYAAVAAALDLLERAVEEAAASR